MSGRCTSCLCPTQLIDLLKLEPVRSIFLHTHSCHTRAYTGGGQNTCMGVSVQSMNICAKPNQHTCNRSSTCFQSEFIIQGHDSYPQGGEPCPLRCALNFIGARGTLQNPHIKYKPCWCNSDELFTVVVKHVCSSTCFQPRLNIIYMRT